MNDLAIYAAAERFFAQRSANSHSLFQARDPRTGFARLATAEGGRYYAKNITSGAIAKGRITPAVRSTQSFIDALPR